MAAHSDAVTCLDISPGGLAFVSGGKFEPLSCHVYYPTHALNE